MAVAYGMAASGLQTYRSNAVLGLTPGQLVLRLYDMAAADLAERDGQHACRVLSELIDSLDFRYEEPALGLFRLYRFCMDQVKRGEFEVPARIVRELRETWAQALAATGQR